MKSTKEKSKFFRFLSNPLFGSISAILTIVSIILVIYFYSEGKSKRELKYYCHPVKATVVKAGQTSSLKVFCENEKIESDVTAVQVAIWNSGKKSIKKDDILEPIILYTEPNTSIIDAAIRKQTREVTNLSIDRDSFKEGFIPVSWRILENNDGGIIQVIFAGGPDVEILAKGIIEGQKTIKQVKYLRKVRGPKEQIEYDIFNYRLMACLYLGVAIYSVLLFIRRYRLKKRLMMLEETIERKVIIEKKELMKELGKRAFLIVHFLLMVSLFAVFVILLIFSKRLGPPFGF